MFKKSLLKIIKILTFALLTLTVFIVIWWFWPAYTPSIKNSGNEAVSQLEYIHIGGLEQAVLTRGKDRNNPILLFLHGGPGMPMMYLAHEFQRDLENDFTVVQWDRRGAGKTYVRNKPSVESMNVRQVVNDAYELIDTLRSRYQQEKIILVGHSFGTHLGSIMVKERPGLFEAYISIGQVVDDAKAAGLQEAFIRERAQAVQRTDIMEALDRPDRPNLENWLFEFGGELKHSTSFFPLVWSGLFASEYDLSEVIKVGEASSFSSSKMKYNVLSESIFNEIKEYQVPVYFFVGTSDYTTPHELITHYYKEIQAPAKDIVYFKESAHFPFFEEPDEFNKALRNVLHDQP